VTPFIVKEEDVIAVTSVYRVCSSSVKIASPSEMTDWQDFINAILLCHSMRALENNFEKHLQKRQQQARVVLRTRFDDRNWITEGLVLQSISEI